jgi:ubiquinone/menaquinone biosynthesis C-methylase UbiE
MNLEDLMHINEGYMKARALQAAVNLKIFDQLASEARSSKGVAESLKLDCRAAELLLDALAAMGVIEKNRGRYINSAAAQRFLVSSSPTYYGALVRHSGAGWEVWGKLEEVIRTGNPVRQQNAHQGDPEDTERFILAMHGLAAAGNYPAMVIKSLNFDNINTVLDVGGGPGTFAVEFCRNKPSLKATILDLPGTLEVTKKVLKNYPEVAGRINLVNADFNKDDIPGSYDMIFISNVIHSESFEKNRRLMKKLFAATKHGGTIVVKDHILNEEGTEPPYGALFSLHMLIQTEGKSYKFSEVEGWLKEAGYKNIMQKTLPAITSASLIIGKKT